MKPTPLRNELARRGLFIRLPLEGPPDDRVLLYRAILDRFLMDCFSPNEETREECKRWFSLENDLFLECCDFALLERDFVVQSVKKAYKILKKEYNDKQQQQEAQRHNS